MPEITSKNGLNDAQMAAVEAGNAPLLIVAGAGTGKTRTLTSRIFYLIERGIAPEKICAITFTNKAASEMANRVAQSANGTDTRLALHAKKLSGKRASGTREGFSSERRDLPTRNTGSGSMIRVAGMTKAGGNRASQPAVGEPMAKSHFLITPRLADHFPTAALETAS